MSWLGKAINPNSEIYQNEQEEEISKGQALRGGRENPDPAASGQNSYVDIIKNWQLMIVQEGTKFGPLS